MAFVQITPPNEAGYCSLGVAVDVGRQAMEQASLVVGEINPDIPITQGDTFVPLSDFDFLVRSTEKPIYFERWPVDKVFDRVAANVASVIEDGSCLAFSLGPLVRGAQPAPGAQTPPRYPHAFFYGLADGSGKKRCRYQPLQRIFSEVNR